MLSAQQKTKYMKNRARIKITTDTEMGFHQTNFVSKMRSITGELKIQLLDHNQSKTCSENLMIIEILVYFKGT